MRILQIVPKLDFSGVSKGVVDIANNLVKNNHEAVVVSNGGKLVKFLNKNIKHINLNIASKNPWSVWKNVNAICSIIKKYNIDIIHARSRIPAWSSYYAAKKLSKLFVTSFHGLYNYSNSIKKYYNSIMTKGKIVIAVSNFIKDHLINDYQVVEEKIRTIYRGVDYNYFCKNNIDNNIISEFKAKYNIKPDSIILLLPARFSRWKGHLLLIDALNLIKNLPFYCVLVGDMCSHPDFVEGVKEKITNLKLQSKIRLFGPEENTLHLYGMTDIILSTSIQPEAFGRTIIEAQSMEKIVIATNIGGAKETIKNEVNGLHFEKNNYEELAERIKYAISIIGTSSEKALTSSARESVIKNFSLEQMQKQTLQVYNELINY